MKKIMILLLLLMIPINVFAIPDKSEYEFVTDQSNTLSDDTKDYILEHSNDLNNIADIDYYVVVVDNLENIDLEKYTDLVYDKYDISSKGLLILLSTRDRKIRVKVGEDLSDIIYSQLIDEYINDYFMPYFKEENWDEGIKNGYSSFYKLLSNYYDINSDDVLVYSDDNIISKYKYPIIFLIIWFNTLIGYIFSEYFLIYFNSKKKKTIDFSIFAISLIISILLMILSYLINPKTVIIVLGFELIAIFSNLNNHELVFKKKKKKKKVNK